MSTRDRKDIEGALERKGFERDETHHHIFVYRAKDGKKTPIRTRTSHGSSHKTLGDPLLAQMAKQVQLTKKHFLDLIDYPEAVLSASMLRYLPRIPATTLLPDALSRLRHEKSHLALVTAADGAVCGMVTLENVVEDLVGTVRDGKHR